MAPLHTACKKADLAGVQAAISAGADVNQKDSGGNAPLVWATYSKSTAAVELLLRTGADPLVRYKMGWTPLHICAKENLPEVAEVLLRFGGDVTARNDAGRQPLDLASGAQVRQVLQRALAAEQQQQQQQQAAQQQPAPQRSSNAQEAAALAQVQTALARATVADGRGLGGNAGLAPAAPRGAGVGETHRDASDPLVIAALRKAAQQADAAAREALEEADLLRTVGGAPPPVANGGVRPPNVAPQQLADMQARVASQVRAAQHQLASARGEELPVPANAMPSGAAATAGGRSHTYGIPSLLANDRAAQAVAAAPGKDDLPRGNLASIRTNAAVQAPLAQHSPRGGPHTPSSARRDLLSPQEQAQRAAAARAPVPDKELERLRAAAGEALQQRRLQEQQQQQPQQMRAPVLAPAAFAQPVHAVRAAARAAPAPVVVRPCLMSPDIGRRDA
jgi:hypothetical protein